MSEFAVLTMILVVCLVAGALRFAVGLYRHIALVRTLQEPSRAGGRSRLMKPADELDELYPTAESYWEAMEAPVPSPFAPEPHSAEPSKPHELDPALASLQQGHSMGDLFARLEGSESREAQIEKLLRKVDKVTSRAIDDKGIFYGASAKIEGIEVELRHIAPMQKRPFALCVQGPPGDAMAAFAKNFDCELHKGRLRYLSQPHQSTEWLQVRLHWMIEWAQVSQAQGKLRATRLAALASSHASPFSNRSMRFVAWDALRREPESHDLEALLPHAEADRAWEIHLLLALHGAALRPPKTHARCLRILREHPRWGAWQQKLRRDPAPIASGLLLKALSILAEKDAVLRKIPGIGYFLLELLTAGESHPSLKTSVFQVLERVTKVRAEKLMAEYELQGGLTLIELTPEQGAVSLNSEDGKLSLDQDGKLPLDQDGAD